MSAVSSLKRYRVTIAEWVHYSIELEASSESDASTKAEFIYTHEVYDKGPVSFEKDAGFEDIYVEEVDE